MQERKNPSSARLATSAKREVPRAGFFRVFYKRKTRQAFSTPDFINQIRAVRRNRARVDKRKRCGCFRLSTYRANPSNGRSRYIRAPLTTVFLLRKNTRLFCEGATRHPCRALKEFSARLATSAKREVPRATCNKREARSSPRRICSRLLSHAATQALHRVSS